MSFFLFKTVLLTFARFCPAMWASGYLSMANCFKCICYIKTGSTILNGVKDKPISVTPTQSVEVWKHQVLVCCGPKSWCDGDRECMKWCSIYCSMLSLIDAFRRYARRSIIWPIGKQVLQREDDNLKNSCFLTKDQENINSVYFSVFNDNYHTFCDTLSDDKASYCRNKTRKKFYSD